jgi:hypothetical protein
MGIGRHSARRLKEEQMRGRREQIVGNYDREYERIRQISTETGATGPLFHGIPRRQPTQDGEVGAVLRNSALNRERTAGDFHPYDLAQQRRAGGDVRSGRRGRERGGRALTSLQRVDKADFKAAMR